MKSVSRVTEYLLYALVILIPFSLRHVFDSAWNFQTGAYSDFTSLSLYISDLALIGLIGFTFLMKPKSWNIPRAWKITAVAAVVWLILELFLQSRETLPLQAYFSLRLLLLMIFASSVSQIRVSREKFAWIFTILGALQGGLAIFQFYAQKSIGLYYLGESHLAPDILGVAKIVSHGTTLIRSYGTFPHANLLSAFLLVCIIFNLYLLNKSLHSPRGESLPRGNSKVSRGIILYICLFLSVFGVFLTFSRAGILALAIGLAIFYVYSAYIKGFSYVSRGIAGTVAAIILSVTILFPYLSTRATFSDNATKERVFYNHVGQQMVKNKPVTGFGAGASVLHMKQFAHDKYETELKPWEIQPIHNYYLISWAEWGIGAIILLFLVLYPIIALIKAKKDNWSIVLLSTSTSFLVLFLFDHYFYTIWPTQLLLWIIIGLSLSSVSRENDPHETTYDTASPQ